MPAIRGQNGDRLFTDSTLDDIGEALHYFVNRAGSTCSRLSVLWDEQFRHLPPNDLSRYRFREILEQMAELRRAGDRLNAFFQTNNTDNGEGVLSRGERIDSLCELIEDTSLDRESLAAMLRSAANAEQEPSSNTVEALLWNIVH